MAEVLNQTHNILSISQEAIPKDQHDHTLIVYLPKRNFIVPARWGENTALIAKLVAEYLELSPSQHVRALEVPAYLGMSDIDLKIWQTLEAIYQVRNGAKE